MIELKTTQALQKKVPSMNLGMLSGLIVAGLDTKGNITGKPWSSD